jgi:hypothetical protein
VGGFLRDRRSRAARDFGHDTSQLYQSNDVRNSGSGPTDHASYWQNGRGKQTLLPSNSQTRLRMARSDEVGREFTFSSAGSCFGERVKVVVFFVFQVDLGGRSQKLASHFQYIL